MLKHNVSPLGLQLFLLCKPRAVYFMVTALVHLPQ